MKKLLVILFLLITNFGFGQSVTAPEPKSFILNTAAQDASGFSLSGFSTTSTLLCAIGLPQAPSGTTFYMTRFDGLTPASGFNFSGNKTRLVFTGTMANINTALATLKVNTTGTAGSIQISISATVNPAGYFYNPSNGHFYRPISNATTYTNARTLSAQQTFKGQTGYLVTITSADEDNFIIANVPQANIWFACTDEVTEGRWIIDAGPEMGTLIKTSNGQFNGNVPGQYNNWAGGEPNNSGNEDYPVTKWGGGTQWNDLPNNFNCAYVVEFGTWTNPDDQTFTEFVSNSVNHSNGEVLRLAFTFDFGSNIDETKFKTKMFTYTDYITGPYNEAVAGTAYTALNGLGKVDKTNDIDTAQILSGGKRALTTAGQVEWAIIDVYSTSFGGHRLYIDAREFDGTGVSPSEVNSIQLFDIYDGPITYVQDAGGWKIFRIVPNISTKITSSAFQSSLRLQNGWYGTKAEFTFTDSKGFKPHALLFESYNETQLQTLLSQIVTVSDVYLAFREFADKGILGDESKYFSSGIQFQNADVNHDNIFDERDCFKLLKHLQGTESLWESAVLPYMMKIIPKSTYDGITKSNWNTYGAYEFIRAKYPVSLTNGILNSHTLDVTWKGDVNLSHSAHPTGFVITLSNSSQAPEIKTMNVSSVSVIEADIMMERIGDSIIATIKLNPNNNEIGATQFIVHYDNSVLDFSKVEFTNNQATNFGRNNGQSVNIGSLNTSGGAISNVGYKIIFKPKTTITNILGLISVQNVETLGTNLNKLSVKIK